MQRAHVCLLGLLVACGRIGYDNAVEPKDGSPEQDGSPGPDASNCDAPAGLLGHWSMDLADISGVQVRDRSGNDYHGSWIGTPAPVIGTGRKGNALDYSSTARAYVELPSLPVNQNAGDFNTVALWYFHPGPDADDVLFYMPPGGGAEPPRYDLWLNTDRIGQPAICINTGGGECWGYSGPELLERWVHVVAVMVNGRTDGGTLYINGAPVSMSCVFGSCDKVRMALNPITIGASDNTYAWHGLLDDVQFYNRALSASEATATYACAQ